MTIDRAKGKRGGPQPRLHVLLGVQPPSVEQGRFLGKTKRGAGDRAVRGRSKAIRINAVGNDRDIAFERHAPE